MIRKCLQYNLFAKIMKSSYKKFTSEVSLVNFDSVNDKLKLLKISPLKIENFQLQQNPSIKQMRTSPFLNLNKQPFDNQQNLYLRMIGLMKQYLLAPETQNLSFLEYAHEKSNLQHLLNKLQNLRLHNIQLQIIFYVLQTNSKKLLKLFIRLREEILKKCGLDKKKFNPVSIHNPHKHFTKQNVKLQGIKIDYEYWGMLVENIAKVEVEEDMLWWASSGNREISAEQFVRICLWSASQK